jgi:hypothetical protein
MPSRREFVSIAMAGIPAIAGQAARPGTMRVRALAFDAFPIFDPTVPLHTWIEFSFATGHCGKGS